MTEPARWRLGDPLHPRHPGIGCSTTLVRLESARPEVAGFMVFLPSGRTLTVSWEAIRHIKPVLPAAKEYVAQVVEKLMQDGGISNPDIQATNWTSVAAAVQRIILDFNDGLTKAIDAKMVKDAIEGKVITRKAALGDDGKFH